MTDDKGVILCIGIDCNQPASRQQSRTRQEAAKSIQCKDYWCQACYSAALEKRKIASLKGVDK